MKRCVHWCIFLMLFCSLGHTQEKEYGLAVLDLQANNISEAEALALSDMLRSSIVNIIAENSNQLTDSYVLIERSQMDKIFDQFDIQNTGCTDVSCAIEFGKMLNAERIIIGSISLVGSTYIVVARIVDVESSNVLVSVDRNVPSPIDNVINLMPLVGHELLTGERLAVSIPQSISVPSQLPTGQSAPLPQAPVSQSLPTDSFLSVSGNPENASAYLNNEKIGETPIDFFKVAPGRYTVRVSHTDHEDFEMEILLSPSANEKVSYNLTPYAILSVNGSPSGSTVTVNGENIGITPINRYTLPARRSNFYELKIIHEGYIGYEETIRLFPGREQTESFSLTALESVSVSSQPSGAIVFIDGIEAGETPLENVTVSEGEHKVKLVSTGYETYSTPVTVSKGDPVSLSWRLIPKTKKGVLTRSLVFPGSGQWYAGYTGKGTLITALQLGIIGIAVVASIGVSDAINEYDTAKQEYMNLKSSASDFDSLYSDAKSKHDYASSAETRQMIAVGATVVVYVYNVIDAMMTEPNIEVNPNFGMLSIEPKIGNDYAGVTMNVRF